MFWRVLLSTVVSLFVAVQCDAQTLPPTGNRVVPAPTTAEKRAVIVAAFEKTHEGWSADEVVLNVPLNDAFIAECRAHLPTVSAADFNWTLLNLRKAGLLKIPTTRRNAGSVARFAPIAEVAARHVFDRLKVSTDRMMTDPELRDMFDTTVRGIDPDVDLYRVRKAAFQLRKQRRLRPELIARIADWGREIKSYSLAEVRAGFASSAPSVPSVPPALSDSSGRSEPVSRSVPALPGIYIFSDPTGYLYIGQSENLRQRLKEHLDASSNFSLAKYLADQGNAHITIEVHAFAADSRAKETMIRRAYESELIASRKPRFNIQP